jgi:hypothetical protein
MKDFFKVTAALTLFILGSLGFLTFARNFDKQPSALLTSTQCSPPCWYGIHPGRSTTSQVYAVLDNFPDVNKDSILGEYNHYEKLIRIYWFFQRPAEDQMGSVNIDNGMATAVNISTVNSLKLAELIKKAGEPEAYWLGTGPRDDGEVFADIVLLAPTKGYVAELVTDIDSGSNHVEIKPGTPVFRVTYFSPDMYEELLGTRILIDKPARRRAPLQMWEGYGSIPVNKN